MVYKFSHFTLNTESKELFYKNNTVVLTKQNYEILSFLVENHGKIVSKQELIDNIWNGRIVADNTIDKSINKLKKILNNSQQLDYFEIQYGKGIRFLPKVSRPAKKKPLKRIVFVAIILLLNIFIFQNSNNSSQQKKQTNNNNPILLFLPENNTHNNSGEKEWWAQNTSILLQDILTNNYPIDVVDFESFTSVMNSPQFLQHLWKLSPPIKIISTEITKNSENYQLSLQIKDKQQATSQTIIHNQKINELMVLAQEWIAKQLKLNAIDSENISLLNSENEIEYYLRSLTGFASGDSENTEKYLSLILLNNQQSLISRIKLIEILTSQEKINEALEQLASLMKFSLNNNLAAKAMYYKGLLMMQQKHQQQAGILFQNALDYYPKSSHDLQEKIKLNLINNLIAQGDSKNALEKINTFLTSSSIKYKPWIIAQLNLTKGKLANNEASTIIAKNLYHQLGILSGEAQANRILAEREYQQAHLVESLKYQTNALMLEKTQNNKVAILTSLSKIALIELTRGHFAKVRRICHEMIPIAKQQNNSVAHLKALEYLIQIDLIQNNPKKEAQKRIKELQKLATAYSDKNTVLKSQLFMIDLLLQQRKLAQVEQMFTHLYLTPTVLNNKKWEIQLDVKKGHYYQLSQQYHIAKTLMLNSLNKAKALGDKALIIMVSQKLIDIYLETSDYTLAKDEITKLAKYKPQAYPFLLLDSKVQLALGNKTKALERANQCKRKSNDYWQSEDENYLIELVNSIRN